VNPEPENANLRSALEERLRFETLIAELSLKFIDLPPGEVDREIEDAQRRVCEFLGLDLSALWQGTAETRGTLTLTHLYRRLGGPPVSEQMDAAEHFPWCLDQLQAGKAVVVSSLDDLPPEASRDRETWRHFGIKTSLTIPLSAGGGPPVGALSFNTVQTERDWPDTIVRRLQLVAQIFANALARKRSDEMLRESEERLNLAAESAGAGLWSLNLATGQYWLTGKTRELFGLAPDEELTFDRFLSLVHPEDRDAIRATLETVVQSDAETRVEYRIPRTDGSLSWFASRGRVRRERSGQPKCVTGVSMDITELKRAEQALAERLDQAVRAASSAPISTID
jgi:formate hydrogenlyase transcriptional activator